MKDRPYLTFALALSVHFLIMWALTYVGVASFDHVLLNWNRFYMAVVMVAPMAMVMMVAMRHMFPNSRVNAGILAAAVMVFVAAFSPDPQTERLAAPAGGPRRCQRSRAEPCSACRCNPDPMRG